MEPPADVHATWDLDGLEVRLPGARIELLEGLRTTLGLGASVGVLLVGIALYQTYRDATIPSVPLLVLMALAPSVLMSVFVALGAVRAWGTPICVRVEPDGSIEHTWLDEPTKLPAADVRTVEARSDPPRVVVTHDRPWVWRVRTDAHAAWLADQLQVVVDRNQARQEGSDAVPAALRVRRSEDR